MHEQILGVIKEFETIIIHRHVRPGSRCVRFTRRSWCDFARIVSREKYLYG